MSLGAQAHAVLANKSAATITTLKSFEFLIILTIPLHSIDQGFRIKSEKERDCIDILQQMQAIRSALATVDDVILKDHAATCIESAIASGNEIEQRAKFGELVDLMGKVRR